MLTTIQVDPARCDGCGRCTVACAMGGAPAEGKEAVPRPPLLWIGEAGARRRIDICRHCETPVCANACVAGAISIDEQSGTVRIATAKCVGCYSCIMECPFQALRLSGGKAIKCDGCSGLSSPLCARFCPTGALQAARGGGLAPRRRRNRAVVRKAGP